MQKNISIAILMALACSLSIAQKRLPFKLPDTGQWTKFTTTPGEDADYIINPSSFTDNGDGTITDNITNLMWQKTDGGEMIYDSAALYCKSLRLGGYDDWRLPTGMELFSINNYEHLNPALDTSVFTVTPAQYWWTSEVRADNDTMIWVVNAGGGIGAHPESETISAGGLKRFQVRAVRNAIATTFNVPRFTDNGNGTIADNYTGLTWQKIQSPNFMTWEQALAYSKTVTLAGKSDWRIPNVKELQSLNDPQTVNPSFDTRYFPNVDSGIFWSSTTQWGHSDSAWEINVQYGIVSYIGKDSQENVLLVRGGMDNTYMNITEVPIPGGECEMGDHFGFVDPSHPSDEIPVHLVSISPLYAVSTPTTNEQFIAFLNSSLLQGLVTFRDSAVYGYGAGTDSIVYYTHQYAPCYSIGYDANAFSIADSRLEHPVVGVSWFGAIAYCNWLSAQNGLQPCYTMTTQSCDFTKNGYRLPTEAEWEYAARGGHTDPYFNYPNGDTAYASQANIPYANNPYDTGTFPYTTPVGFYDGTIKQKSNYNWPGGAATYQTSNGVNGFGLYDVQANVWEFVNDWYTQNYYTISPINNPTGPDSGFPMPDGKPYRVMRAGNWANGDTVNGVNDGHSRVSNRDPSFYRGPTGPGLDNYSWCAVGFRVVRNDTGNASGIKLGLENLPEENQVFQNYPNPFNSFTQIQYQLGITGHVKLQVLNTLGETISTLTNSEFSPGKYTAAFDGRDMPAGVYFLRMDANGAVQTRMMELIR